MRGTLFYNKAMGRYDFECEDEDGTKNYYGGIHCGEVFEIQLNDVWVPARVEYQDGAWYLVGLPGLKLDGLCVRRQART